MHLLLKFLLISIKITILHFQFHTIADATFDSKRFLGSAVISFCDLIHRKKTKSADLTQGKRLGLYDIQCLISEMLINLTDFLRCNLKWGKICCQIPDCMTVLICQNNLIQFFPGDSLDLQ